MSDPYGAQAGQYTVELHVVALLQKWLPTEIVRAARRYAAMPGTPITSLELEAMMTSGEFPFAPRGITVTTSFDDWPIDALPHVQVIAPSWTPQGTDQVGIAESYEVQVCNLVGAQGHADTRFIRACYEDAIPIVLMQHQGIEGLPGAGGVQLVGGGSAEFAGDEKDSRTFQGSLAMFEVLVHGVLDPRGGPAAPGPLPVVTPGDVPPPDSPYPTVLVDGATVELTAEEVD